MKALSATSTDIDFLQAWLDTLSDAAMAGDFETYIASISLPFTLVTSAGAMVQTTEDDMRDGFEAFHAMLKTLRATQIIRIAERVDRVSANVLTGLYETQILQGGQRLFAPFRSSVTLVMSGNHWKAAQIANGMTNHTWPIVMPRIDSAASP